MNEWFDETLVTIEFEKGVYRVRELPARKGQPLTAQRTFKQYEQAEQYIDDQYPAALSVQPDDFRAEVQNRKALIEEA